MSNVVLAYPCKSDAATLSGGSWLAALPLTNMQTEIVAQVARSADTMNASTQFDADFGATRGLSVLGLVNHNFSPLANVRVQASSVSNFSTTTYDSGWQPAWPSVYSIDTLEWEDENYWSGQLTEEQMGTSRPTFVLAFGSTRYGRYWRVEIDDETNGDLYVEIGRLFLAPSWVPAYNMAYGVGLRWEPLYDSDQSLGGTRYVSPRWTARVTKFALENMPASDAWPYALEMQRQLGAHGQLIVVSDPDDTDYLQQRSFLATLRSISDVAIVGPLRHATVLELQEVI